MNIKEMLSLSHHQRFPHHSTEVNNIRQRFKIVHKLNKLNCKIRYNEQNDSEHNFQTALNDIII